MSSSAMHNMIDEAARELRRQRERLETIRKKVDGSTTKVTSKDRLVTVTIGQGGNVESIEFNSQKFRRMAPAELSAVLVETISQAQTQGRERLYRAFRPLLPKGMGLDFGGTVTGKTTLEQMYEDAIRQVDELTPDGTPIRTNGNGHANGNGHVSGNGHANGNGHAGSNGHFGANGHHGTNGNGSANGHSGPNGNGRINGKDNPDG
jgi:hypothetical protein